MDTQIRLATALDAVAIVKLLKKGYAEGAFPFQEADDGLAVGFVMQAILHGFTLVAERSNRVVGVHASFFHPEEWGTKKFVDNAFFYVVPAERRRGTARKMQQYVERNADRAAAAIRLGTFLPRNADEAAVKRERAHCRMLRMNGYRYIGSVFIREPHLVEQTQSDDDAADERDDA